MNDQDISTVVIADEEIIKRILRGEKDLFALIVRKYNQRLYRVGMGIINDDAEVEDIMQVAYIKAYENLEKFEFKSAFATWITRILINESLLRLKKRKHLSGLEDIINSENHYPHSMDKQTPLSSMLGSELKEILEKSIHSLPEKYRVVFIMREIENMNVADTKECLGISEANVKVRLNRAKSLLRNSLNSYITKGNLLHFHLTRCDDMVRKVMQHIEAFKG